ncbi:MAG: hypothetical protein HRF43_11560 [Phycisphaerae bacterium]|jgi:hypothetical protein
MQQWHLRQLPASARLMLTGFLAITGTGYLVAVANIYYSHRAADGNPESLSLDDVRAVYAGLTVEVKAGQAPPSRMLEMARTKMREFFKSDAEFEALEGWLIAGARQETFQTPLPGVDKSPHDILSDSCIRCHAPDGEKAQEKAHKSPFAADILSPVDYQLISKFTRSAVTETAGQARVPPQSTQRLVLVSHVHMLSIPVFTLMTSLLCALTRLPALLRGPLVAVPMLALVVDFAGWWLARQWAPAVWLIVGAGPVFGVFFGAQVVVAFLAMWFGRRPENE